MEPLSAAASGSTNPKKRKPKKTADEWAASKDESKERQRLKAIAAKKKCREVARATKAAAKKAEQAANASVRKGCAFYLGIDPGIVNLGLALFDKAAKRFSVVRLENVRIDPLDPKSGIDADKVGAVLKQVLEPLLQGAQGTEAVYAVVENQYVSTTRVQTVQSVCTSALQKMSIKYCTPPASSKFTRLDGVEPAGTQTYADRKRTASNWVQGWLATNSGGISDAGRAVFEGHNKKDDMADAMLLALMHTLPLKKAKATTKAKAKRAPRPATVTKAVPVVPEEDDHIIIIFDDE
jgi:Holliday junction resolvasome RuvABC endonuclease subunit